MGWTSTFHGDKGYIEYLFTGDLSFKELQEAVLHALKHSEEQNINKFLADCREIKFSSSTSILETYELAKFYENLNVKRHVKEAIVYPHTPEFKESFSFFEMVISNRDFNIRVFTSYTEALNWLLKKN